ncbi:MAG: hypothetical protein HC853_03320 [Anaerolineae bacterium]|nr:hypothetical protein [Anaerolineae bacterium]
MTEIELDEFENFVTRTARVFVYPNTPVLRQRAAPLQRRMVLAVCAAALVLAAVLLAVPSARAAVLRFLQIGVVRIEFQEPTPIPTSVVTPSPIAIANPIPSIPMPTPTPTRTPQPLADQLDLYGKTTLREARARMPVKVPTALGEPDAVYLQDIGGDVTVLVWFDEAPPGKVRMSLQVFTNNVFANKMPPTVLRKTTVKGIDAAWVEGEHILKVRSGDYVVTQLVSKNALIWTEGRYTYRLETDLSMAEAVKIAETVP